MGKGMMRGHALMALAATLVLQATALAGQDSETWNFNESTNGQDVFYVSPTNVDPSANLYDASYVITTVEVTVRVSIFTFPVDVTDQVPPELLSNSSTNPGPAPILLFDDQITYPDPPTAPAIDANVRVELDAGGFGRLSVTNITLGSLLVDVPGFGMVNAQLVGFRVAGSVTVTAINTVPGDLDGSGCVDLADLGLLLGCWNAPCGDLTGDSTTDLADLGVLFGNWNAGCAP